MCPGQGHGAPPMQSVSLQRSPWPCLCPACQVRGICPLSAWDIQNTLSPACCLCSSPPALLDNKNQCTQSHPLAPWP